MDEPITRREQYYAAIAEALGGGGGGGAETVTVHLTAVDPTNLTADKTAGEIAGYIAEGKIVLLVATLTLGGITGTGIGVITSELDFGSGYTTFRAETTDVSRGYRYIFNCKTADGANSTAWEVMTYPLDCSPVVVNLENDGNGHFAADKTNAEILAYMDAGRNVFARMDYDENITVETQITEKAIFPSGTSLVATVIHAYDGLLGVLYTDGTADNNTNWVIAIFSLNRAL